MVISHVFFRAHAPGPTCAGALALLHCIVPSAWAARVTMERTALPVLVVRAGECQRKTTVKNSQFKRQIMIRSKLLSGDNVRSPCAHVAIYNSTEGTIFFYSGSWGRCHFQGFVSLPPAHLVEMSSWRNLGSLGLGDAGRQARCIGVDLISSPACLD